MKWLTNVVRHPRVLEALRALATAVLAVALSAPVVQRHPDDVVVQRLPVLDGQHLGLSGS